MTQYKGYYIDKMIFNTKQEIDNFIKKQAIERYQMFCKMFAKNADEALAAIMMQHEDKLHNEFGLTYEEIEQLEIAAYQQLYAAYQQL